MENRREFLEVPAAAALISNQVRGANDRVQMGIIGVGTRGRVLHEEQGRHVRRRG
jgi:hypothetical protein